MQNNDTFEFLAQDLMEAFTAVIVAIEDLSAIEADGTAEEYRAALGIIAKVGHRVGAEIALRGAILAGEITAFPEDESDAA